MTISIIFRDDAFNQFKFCIKKMFNDFHDEGVYNTNSA